MWIKIRKPRVKNRFRKITPAKGQEGAQPPPRARAVRFESEIPEENFSQQAVETRPQKKRGEQKFSPPRTSENRSGSVSLRIVRDGTPSPRVNPETQKFDENLHSGGQRNPNLEENEENELGMEDEHGIIEEEPMIQFFNPDASSSREVEPQINEEEEEVKVNPRRFNFATWAKYL